MLYYDICFSFPTAIVWLIGLMMAVVKSKQHPEVSWAVFVGMACLLAATAVYVAGVRVLFSSLSPASRETIMIGLSVMGVVVALLRAAGWAATLTAAFGWRDAPAARDLRALWQFSIRQLLIVTLAVAILCGVARTLINLLGASATALLGLADELPTVVCWVVGIRLAWKRWDLHAEVSLRVIAAIVLSSMQLVIGIWVYSALIFIGGNREWLIFPYLLFAVVAGPISWALLLAAAFGWRMLDQPFRAAPSEQSPTPSQTPIA